MMRDIYRCCVCGAFTEEPQHCGKPAELLLDGRRREMLSKLMSFLLRHDPSAAGLRMDQEGWVSVDDLVEGIRKRWRNADLYSWVRREHVIAIAALDPKGRFELRNGMIRARYGHSAKLNLRLSYPRDHSSRTLFHGTAPENLDSIMREGLKPMKRAFVHLSLSPEDACEVGRRHSSKPVVLVIDAECLRKHGIEVLVASRSVRLAKYVPSRCISRILDCERGEEKAL